ncbi:hypothetical protein XENTR_v10005274 [Xenopus tropicalis]|nr:hypothetical protein XENTR_v10005274 [Xenopus tropicalis]
MHITVVPCQTVHIKFSRVEEAPSCVSYQCYSHSVLWPRHKHAMLLTAFFSENFQRAVLANALVSTSEIWIVGLKQPSTSSVTALKRYSFHLSAGTRCVGLGGSAFRESLGAPVVVDPHGPPDPGLLPPFGNWTLTLPFPFWRKEEGLHSVGGYTKV